MDIYPIGGLLLGLNECPSGGRYPFSYTYSFLEPDISAGLELGIVLVKFSGPKEFFG
jgi:hypothetical protein